MIRCSKCQRQLPENAQVCDFCGSPVNLGQQKIASSGYEGVEVAKNKKSAKGIIIAVIAIVVALAIGVGGFFIGKNLSSDDDSSDDKKSNTVLEDDKNKENNNEVKNKEIERIKKKGTLVVGVTDFVPMGFKVENGDWSGFDVELAREFAKELGVEVEFKEIEWSEKVTYLNNGEIDCVWNGLDVGSMDIDGMDCSDYYLKDSQIIVVREDSIYNDKDYLDKNFGNMTFAVVDGTMAKLIADEQGLDSALYAEESQALEAVASDLCDAALLDTLSLGSLLSRCNNLVSVWEIQKTYFVVGFRKGSELTAEVNDFLRRKTEDGTIIKLAQKYGLEDCVIGGKPTEVVPTNVEVKLTKDSSNGYFSVSAYIPGVTKYDASATENFEALILLKYKNESGTFMRFMSTDVEFKEVNGNIFIKGTIELEDLIPGQTYEVTIQKGVFVNDDNSVINGEYECEYVYTE